MHHHRRLLQGYITTTSLCLTFVWQSSCSRKKLINLHIVQCVEMTRDEMDREILHAGGDMYPGLENSELIFIHTGVGSSKSKAGCVGTSGTGVQIHTCCGRASNSSETKCGRAGPHGCNPRASVSISREGTYIHMLISEFPCPFS